MPTIRKKSYSISELDTRYVNITGDTMTGNLDMNLNQILNLKVEQVTSLPATGNKSKIVYLTTDQHLYIDQG